MSCKVVSKNCDFFRSRSQISSRRFKNWWESSFHINLSSKKNWSKKKFWEKNDFENFDFRFFFRTSKKNLENQKTDFQKTSRKKSIFKKKHVFSIFHFFLKMLIFFWKSKFSKLFFSKKNYYFLLNFFLMKGLCKNLIRTDFWSGSRILSVSDPLLNIRLARFIQTSLHN